VVGISGSDRVEAVSVRNTETKQVTELPAQEVVAALGFTADITPLEAWGLERRGAPHRRGHDDGDQSPARSSLPATSRSTPARLRLISVGFGEVATAGLQRGYRIDPRQPFSPGHSTEQAGEGPAA